MNVSEIIARRLTNQGLVGTTGLSATRVVGHLGAVQAQDYYGAKWAIGQRSGVSAKAIDKLFDDGRILRTHLCRPTWHFVRPVDIRWLLQATAARVHQANAVMYRKCGLTPKLLARATDLIAKALSGGKNLERNDLMAVLQRAKLDTSDFRSAYYMMFAELEGVVCSGPRAGKQFTYALLDERVPKAAEKTMDEALGELAKRYFTSRGPASLSDFTMWGGLTMAQAKKAISIVAADFHRKTINARDHWYPNDREPFKLKANTVHLLPNYDEYGIGYKDRSAFYDPAQAARPDNRAHPVFRHLILLDGKMLGTWDRQQSAKSAAVQTSTFIPFSAAQQRALENVITEYNVFLGLKTG